MVKRMPNHDDSQKLDPWGQPLLRWAGSKRRLLPQLMAATPENYGTYIEPFAGSACLFFALKPESAILGDVNSELIHAYSVLAKHPRLVSRQVRGWNSSDTTYYSIRATNPADLDEVQRAARFIYLNRHCFNGVYRINRQGQFNVPKGVRTGSVPSEQQFYRCSVALRNAKLISSDFFTLSSKAKEGDFVYLDPPYASIERPTHGEYSYDSFGRDDLPRLISSLEAIDHVGATFLVSYSYAKSTELTKSGWPYKRIQVQRHVAGFSKHRKRVYEILLTNNPKLLEER